MRDIYHSDNISIVIDNNVLMDLFELNCLTLIFDMFDEVIIPQVIYDDELLDAIKVCIKPYKYRIGKINTQIGLDTYGLLVNEKEFKKLSRYDRFAISIAKENLYYCNSNDKLVRKACEKFDIKYTGVLGVLGRAYYKDIITKIELNAYIDQLSSDETSCYISLNIIEQFKKEIDFLK